MQKRCEQGLVNADVSVATKPVKKIIKDNALTLFNIINFVLAAAVFYVGSYKNLTFMGVVLCNLIISTVQEIRAKRAVDKLSIISSAKADVLRDGSLSKVEIHDLVLDDLVRLRSGQQVPSDCILVNDECEANESLITGEADSLRKKPGDTLLSGSFLVSGSCLAKVEHVGLSNYATKISHDTKYVKKVNSQILRAFKRIILVLSLLIIPIGAVLFMRQMGANTFEMAVVNTVGALVGMIPEGLMLLTSTVLAVSVVRLSRIKVLVQELYCIETLAHVDVLCLDKTGTITEGKMKLDGLLAQPSVKEADLEIALASFAKAIQDSNQTLDAILSHFKGFPDKKLFVPEKIVAFSSEKKWSGVSFKGQGSFVLGAAEFVLKTLPNELKEELSQLCTDHRVLVFAHSTQAFNGENLPESLELMGLVLLSDVIRKNAQETLRYFEDEGVEIKVISGDNVCTVEHTAKAAGVKNFDKSVDVSKLGNDEEIAKAATEYTVFGRVLPAQKKILIRALKDAGFTVAMTGDGVNDVMALKEADCSVCMAGGSDAARNVSELVLLDSNFEAMPKVVLEGRRSINNIQRSSSLFLVKTIYATLLAVVFLFLRKPYPFMPIQMTLTSVLTIGIPSFVLALEPNKSKISGNLLLNIVSRALPCALTIVTGILGVMFASHLLSLPSEEVSTLCVILTGFGGLLLLFHLCEPFNLMRKILFGSMSALFFLGIVCETTRNFFSLSPINIKIALLLLVFGTIMYFLFGFLLSGMGRKRTAGPKSRGRFL